MEILELFRDLSALSIVLFCVGVILLVIEMCHPGFGVAGVLGLACLAADIFISARSLREGIIMTGVVALTVLILAVISITLVSKGKLPRTLMLKEAADKASGYTGGAELEKYLGKRGKAISELRPAGTAEIDGERVDVVSQGDFIDPGSDIEVIETGGNRIVVKEINKKDQIGEK